LLWGAGPETRGARALLVRELATERGWTRKGGRAGGRGDEAPEVAGEENAPDAEEMRRRRRGRRGGRRGWGGGVGGWWILDGIDLGEFRGNGGLVLVVRVGSFF
jgi:hypothetical protein